MWFNACLMLVVCHFGQMTTTTICEDITASISQANEVYIKRDSKKEIWSKLFFTHDLQKNGDNDIQQVRSSDGLKDMFLKNLPTTMFEELVKNIRIRRLKDLNYTTLHFFSLFFFPHWVFLD